MGYNYLYETYSEFYDDFILELKKLDKYIREDENGQGLNLEIEEDNIYDMYVIEIWTKDKENKLGYVLAVYIMYSDKLVEEVEYAAVIDEVNTKTGPYQILEVKFRGEMVNPKVEETKFSIA